MSSILTNNSAMVALQTLKSINGDLSKTQSMISTGKDVSSAKDNAAVWAISKTMESDVKGFKAISDSLSLGETTVSVARQASETVTDLLTDIKGKIVAAQEANVDRTKLQTDITALTDQIGAVVDAAQFNGLNLIDGTSTEDLAVLSSLNRGSDGNVTSASIDVARQNLSLTDAATTAAFDGAAADDGTLGSIGATDDDSDVTVVDSANTPITINSVTEGAGYRITLSDVQLSAPGGGTSVGSREFLYVATASDSVDSVRDNLSAQISAYLGASTDSGDYTVTNGTNAGEFTIANGSGEDLTLKMETQTGATPGTTSTAAGLGGLSAIDVTNDTGAGSALAAIDALIDKSIDAAAAFGSAQGRLETQSDFISNLSDSLKSGIGSMVDANMEEASARLQALQVQQQLGVQSLSIANQAPQSILSLFR